MVLYGGCKIKWYGIVYINNRYTASYFVLPSIIFYIYRFWGLMYFMGSVINSVVYLETINYIEHYGLRRKEIEPG